MMSNATSRSSRSAGVTASSLHKGKSATTTSRPYTSRSRPRTVATSSGYHDNEIICVVSEARGIAPTVGLSFVNITTCEAVLCQFADTQTFARTCHKIKVFSPSEIIFASNAADTKLISILRENLDADNNGIRMEPIDRKYWSEMAGHEYLQRLAFPDDLNSLRLSVAGNFFAMCCFAAALNYIDMAMGITFTAQALRIKFEPSEGAMMIDLSTIASLELVQNLHSIKSKDCLFGLLNETTTQMGARVLKSNILQPSTDEDKIKTRHDAVSELSSREAIFVPVREALQNFVDADKVLAALVVVRNNINFSSMEQSINHIIMLKSFVDSILPVWQALTGVESDELHKIRQLCHPDNYVEVRQLITYAINEEIQFSNQATKLRTQRVFAIKAGVNGFLDVARQTYNEINQDVSDMVEKLKEDHALNLDLQFDPLRQYYFRIKAVDLEDKPLPAAFINVYRNKRNIECQTMDLIKTNQKLKDAHNEVVIMSSRSIEILIDNLRAKIHPLFKISEGIAMLDMLTAFAQLTTVHDYIKPDIINTLAIKNGRHPILDKIQHNKFVPNDVYATQQTRFQIITGCNMSGKSTYIRSIALMTVMAQIGCFVPAQYASFPVIHQLFARISTDDNIEANVSTFACEMREIAFILHNVEPRSLIIVDELGRGTSTTDGLAIAIAISEALIESKAYVWFVTHFRDLPRILAERAGVVNMHLAVDIAADFSRMKMIYRVSEGYEEQKFYGLALATLMNLPQELVDTAAEVSKALNARSEARKQSSATLAVAKRRKLVLKLKEQLMQAKESDIDVDTLKLWLKRLQQEFIIRLSAINAEADASCESIDTEDNKHDEAAATTEEIQDRPVEEKGCSSSFGLDHAPIIISSGTVSAAGSPQHARSNFGLTRIVSTSGFASENGELIDDMVED